MKLIPHKKTHFHQKSITITSKYGNIGNSKKLIQRGLNMQTVQKKVDNFTLCYPLENIAPLSEILFVDIETTGFTAQTSQLYLIGCAFYEDNAWYIRQYFANRLDEEAEILINFHEFSNKYKVLIHFNGNNFDIPYLNQKCEQLGLPFDFCHFQGIDLYKRVTPYKKFLKLPNCKQKTIEQYLGIDRKDIYSGGELISLYHDFVKDPSIELYETLLLHNADDMKGMLQLIPILAYYDLFNMPIKVTKVQANRYTDYQGISKQELVMKLVLPSSLPSPISNIGNGFYFNGKDKEGILKVPIYEEEMKYFYTNYKDYYYLPVEDLALHKSVATFVDKEFRKQATAATCYTRKFSKYLPQWDVLINPFFKRDYKSKDLFFELTDELKTNRKFFSDYASHIMNLIAINQ